MANLGRMEKLKKLSPLEAVQTWLDGDFGINEEPALIFAIRKDSRITLSDDDIIEVILDAMMNDDCDAAKCLESLAAAR
jgi:hypothetical protein